MTLINSGLGQRLLPDAKKAKIGWDLEDVPEDPEDRPSVRIRPSTSRPRAAQKQPTTSTSTSTCWGRAAEMADQYFALSLRGSDFSNEFRAGTTAFLASANNFIVNAQIMEHAGIKVVDSVVSGAFCAAVACALSGLLSNLPLGLLPSVGPNVFLAFSLVAGGMVDTDQALAISGACGLSLMLLSLTPVLKVVLGLVPLCIKYGLLIGTGLLSALIGLKSIGVVVPDTGPTQDIVALGNLQDRRVAITFVFLIIMASMQHRGVKGAVLIGMLGATVCAWIFEGGAPEAFFALRSVKPHALDCSILLGPYAWGQVGVLLLLLLFSISGALTGSGRMAGLLTQDGAVPGSTAVYIVAGAATMLSAACGGPPIFVSMSASAGIREGGRTGLTSLVMAAWCLLTAFVFSPVAAAIPPCAVSPVLILVGMSMLGEAREVAWWSTQEALPAFLCAVFPPFTYSVANGIYAGLGMSIVLFFTTGTFVTYLPGRRKQMEEEVQSSVQISEQDLEGMATGKKRQTLILQSIAKHSGTRSSIAPGAQKGQSALKTPQTGQQARPRKQSQAILQQRFGFSENDLNNLQDEQPELETALAHVGRESRLKAMSLIERAAQVVGLDPDEIHKVVEERMLGGARNVEAHWSSGIAGWEVDMAMAVRSASGGADHTGPVPTEAEAPFLAAAARRERFRSVCCHKGGVLDTLPEQ